MLCYISDQYHYHRLRKQIHFLLLNLNTKQETPVPSGNDFVCDHKLLKQLDYILAAFSHLDESRCYLLTHGFICVKTNNKKNC